MRTMAVASEPRAQVGRQPQREPGDSDGPRSHEARSDHGATAPTEGARAGAAGDGQAGTGAKGEAARSGGAASTIHLERALAAGAERDVVGRLRHDGEMRLTLEPRGLGELEVRVAVRDGGVHASVATTSDDARHLLASQRAHLETALERYNLRLDSFSVGVGGDGRPAFEREGHLPLAAGWQGGALASDVREPAQETPAFVDGWRGGTLSIRA
jgi:flagellar hook-length control protein FliK